MRGLAVATIGYWLPIAVAVVVLTGLGYILVQQDLRMSANDPQIQLAEDAAGALVRGQTTAAALVPSEAVNVVVSLAPFLIVYDAAGNVVASSGQLDGRTPELPSSVLSDVRARGQDRITWQPQQGVRLAAVIVRVDGGSGGYVLAARSLREVERREGNVQILAGLIMVGALGATLAATGAAVALRRGLFASGPPREAAAL